MGAEDFEEVEVVRLLLLELLDELVDEAAELGLLLVGD